MAVGFSIGLVLLATPVSLTGNWNGHVVVDMPKVMSRVTSSEHRKLILYTLDRLKKATFLLHLSPNGHFTYMFDDGYHPDHEQDNGTWKQLGDTITFGRLLGDSKLLGGTRLHMPFHHAVGVSVEFIRTSMGGGYGSRRAQRF